MRKRIVSLLLVAVLVLTCVPFAFAASTYTVKSGDVLWKIAEANGTTWQKLAEINSLKDPSLITPGQVLKLDGTAAPAGAKYKAGTYTATTAGINGPIKVQVKFSDTAITEVKVLSNSETEGLGSVAIATYPELIVKNQSLAVDTVTGATVTSKALIAAVEQCIKEAGAEPAAVSVPAQSGPASYKAGTYTGIGDGRGGPIVVKVTFSNTAITDIKVISQHETYRVGDIPLLTYPELIIKNQSLAVDVMTGATISSVGFLNAIKQAVTAAGGDPAKLNAPIPSSAKPAADTTADVVVVGSGASGMTAAVKAAAAGSKVILVEKLSILGGTSAYSIESFGASQSGVHKGLGVAGTSDDMYNNYVKGNPKGIPEAFDILAHKNGAAADWLKSIGAPLTVASSPFSVAANREAGKMGTVIVSALIDEVKKKGVDIRTNTRATGLVTENGAVTGVTVKAPNGEYTIKAKSVVLATGGYAANNEMVAKVWPALKGFKNSCSPGATGDGINMAQAVGAQLRDMDYIRVNFTYYTDGLRVYYMGSLPNMGAIFVNNDGKRFINDQAGYGAGKAVMDQGGTGWMILDNSLLAIQDVREYYELGIFQSAPTVGELADKIGVNKANLEATVEKYKGFVAKGKDDDFGRTMLNMTFDEAPYYAVKMTCHVQGTFGGVVTDTSAQVLNADGKVIPGLYAAGETASVGTYGQNPMATNIVFGTIAGESAAAYAK